MQKISNREGLGQFKQQGFTLVELMIGIALSIILLLGVLQIFDANRSSSRIQQGYAEVQEGGRIASEMLIRDIRMADYWGCAPDTASITDHLNTADGDYDPSMSITGADGVAGSDNVSSMTIGGITVKDGTDTLTLRGTIPSSNTKVKSPYMNVTAAVIHIFALGAVIPDGKVILISDCRGGDLFANTNDIDGTEASNSTVNIGHNTGGPSSEDGKMTNAFKNLARTYNASAQITIPYIRIYFVGQNPAGGWSLYRSEDGVASELVRNVDDLQFTYGEDTNTDQSADKFGVASAVNMDDVISVRAQITVHSDNSVTDSGALKRTYSVTSAIRNRAL